MPVTLVYMCTLSLLPDGALVMLKYLEHRQTAVYECGQTRVVQKASSDMLRKG